MSRYRLSTLLAIPSFILTALVLASPSFAGASASAEPATVPETKMALRDLWVEHVFWIRSYVLANHAQDATQARIAEAEVVANAKALAGAITPFYGQSASDALFKLLAGHWDAIRDYNTATLAQSTPGQDQAVAALTQNAREIAKFLSGANPNLPEATVFGLLSTHGGHHVAQINQVNSGDFRNEAATWHEMRKHIVVISDAIADALAKQFPARFQDPS